MGLTHLSHEDVHDAPRERAPSTVEEIDGLEFGDIKEYFCFNEVSISPGLDFSHKK